MSRFNFYYDESEHSRKINKATFSAENYYDNFVVAVVGWKETDERAIEKIYLAFENKYSDRKANCEIKSTTLKSKSLANGFASLNDANAKFLKDYLDVFDEKISLHFSVISKIEYIVHQMFENYHNSFFVDIDAMKYTIIKSIMTYRPEGIIEAFFESPKQLVLSLRNFYKKQIEKNKQNIKLKEYENVAFSQILILLDSVSEDINNTWNYDIAFQGFSKYLQEKNIREVKLYIDKEGDAGNTINAAKRAGIFNSEEVDSKDSFGVRFSDMLVGLISKLLKAFKNAREYNETSEQYKKKLLNIKWFKLNEQQFRLYKRLALIILKLNDAWYKSYGGVYSDDLIYLVSLLSYIDRFDSLEMLNKTELHMHGEYLNSHTCENLMRHFEKNRSKLPIDVIPETNAKFYYNQRGAKVCFDISEQELISIPQGKVCLDVFSVGFTGDMFPTITVNENGKAICYRLPAELIDWALNCVAIADTGTNVFPSKVIISKKGKNYYADIV